MSLNWDAGNIKDWDDIKWVDAPDDHDGEHEWLGGIEWQYTHGMIFASMVVGLNEVTEANWEKWYARCKYIQEMEQPDWNRWVTPEIVHRRIGLSTNVENVKDGEWAKRQMKWELMPWLAQAKEFSKDLAEQSASKTEKETV